MGRNNLERSGMQFLVQIRPERVKIRLLVSALTVMSLLWPR